MLALSERSLGGGDLILLRAPVLPICVQIGPPFEQRPAGGNGWPHIAAQRWHEETFEERQQLLGLTFCPD
eukprot:11168338-Lingulodinium_polyedra.AAC.1